MKIAILLLVVSVMTNCRHACANDIAVRTLAIEPENAPARPVSHVNWDAERTDPVAIVIHHTGSATPLTPEGLSAAGLEHGYSAVFKNGNADPYIALDSRPYSGHFVRLNDKVVETFALYHVYINAKGESIQYLSDRAIGWHAGNWQVNRESLAIVLEGDFTETSPLEKMLESAAAQIVQWCGKYPNLKYLSAHREVRKEITICPGEWYFSGGAERLISLANRKAGKDLGLSRDYPKRVR